jgi:hypothetical protein
MWTTRALSRQKDTSSDEEIRIAEPTAYQSGIPRAPRVARVNPWCGELDELNSDAGMDHGRCIIFPINGLVLLHY